MIVDPEAVKNICNASVDSKGFCFYKATNRIKRHKACLLYTSDAADD